MAARTPMCFQFGVQFENLFKLVCQGGTADCLLYHTHVGRFDTTCAGNGAEQKPQTTRHCILQHTEMQEEREKKDKGEGENEEEKVTRLRLERKKQKKLDVERYP